MKSINESINEATTLGELVIIMKSLMATTADLAKRATEDREKAEKDRIRAEETTRQLDKVTKRQDREREAIKQELWIWGRYGEETAYQGMQELFGKRAMEVHEILRNKKWHQTGREYDLIAINDKFVIVTEVKTTVKIDDILYFLDSQLPDFLRDFPEYQGYAIYGCMAGMIFPSNFQKMLYKQWVFVMKLSETHYKLANDKDFVPVSFANKKR
jgi:hypothetical protein